MYIMEGTVSVTPSKVTNLDEEALDPRVQIELENLNVATDEINRLEATLEEANAAFRSSLNDTSVQLQSLAKKLGSCVEKARPYYEAKEKAKKLQMDCQRAAVQYQRANAVHQAARETIALAEERFTNLKENGKERKFDSAWQEMLNHATMKIMEAEAQKSASEREHQKRAASYTAAEREVQELNRKLKTAINKSRPYFNHRAATQVKLEAQKDRIYKLQKDIMGVKNKYSLTLRNLEQISEEIHELRRINVTREPGVGAEMDQCDPFIEKAPSRESLLDSTADEDQEYWNTLKEKLVEIGENEKSEKEEGRQTSVLIHEDTLSVPYENFPSGKRNARGHHRPCSTSEKEISCRVNEESNYAAEGIVAIEGIVISGDLEDSSSPSQRRSDLDEKGENAFEEISLSDILIEENGGCPSSPRPQPSGQSSGSLESTGEGTESGSGPPGGESPKSNLVSDAVKIIEDRISSDRSTDKGSQLIGNL